jgi:hypothetical protein
MIANSTIKIRKVRPHIENKSPGDQSDSPKDSKKRTECASQITACRKRIGKCDGDETEADKANTYERIIDPEQLTDEWRERGEMRSHIDNSRHERTRTHQSEMQHASDLKQQGQVGYFHFSSGCADGLKHRQDNVPNKNWMKKPEGRTNGAN